VAERIGVAKVSLGGKGKPHEVGKRMQMFGRDLRRVELFSHMLHFVVGEIEGPPELCELQRSKIVALHDLGRAVEHIGQCIGCRGHGVDPDNRGRYSSSEKSRGKPTPQPECNDD